MVTLDMIRKPVEGDLEAFEQFIRQKFTADGTLLSEMLDYALSARGKGIRPMTVLLSAALNAPAGQRSGGLRALLAATLVEMIHVASLIHDDVIDESDMRRGRASVNARWQSRNAVVVGDYILAKNMDLGLKSGQFDLVTHVCGAIATLCEGEILQNDKANRQEMTRASYLDIIYKKTACLIGVSASAGALAVGASREKQALMRKFGESIGMGVPDSGRHSGLYPHGPYGQALQQRLARTQGDPAAAHGARVRRRGAPQGVAGPAGPLPRGG